MIPCLAHIFLPPFFYEVFFLGDNRFQFQYIHISKSGREQGRFSIRTFTILERLFEWFEEINYGIAFWTGKDSFAFARKLAGRGAAASGGSPIR